MGAFKSACSSRVHSLLQKALWSIDCIKPCKPLERHNAHWYQNPSSSSSSATSFSSSRSSSLFWPALDLSPLQDEQQVLCAGNSFVKRDFSGAGTIQATLFPGDGIGPEIAKAVKQVWTLCFLNPFCCHFQASSWNDNKLNPMIRKVGLIPFSYRHGFFSTWEIFGTKFSLETKPSISCILQFYSLVCSVVSFPVSD